MAGGDAALRPRPVPLAERVEALVVPVHQVGGALDADAVGRGVDQHVLVRRGVDQHAVVLFGIGLGVGRPLFQVAAEGELHALQQQRVGRNRDPAEAQAVGAAEQHAAMFVAAPPALRVILVAEQVGIEGAPRMPYRDGRPLELQHARFLPGVQVGAGHGPAARGLDVGLRIAAQTEYPAALMADDAARPAEVAPVIRVGHGAQRTPGAQVAALGHADVEAVAAVGLRPHHRAEQPKDAGVIVEQGIAVGGLPVAGQEDRTGNRRQVDARRAHSGQYQLARSSLHASPRLAAPWTLLASLPSGVQPWNTSRYLPTAGT